MTKPIMLFQLFVFIFTINIYSQNTIYVSNSGNDNNGNGNISNPYATIQYALNHASDNDTIILRGGTYISEEIRIENNNITIKSYPGEWAVIQASTNVEDITSCIWYHEPTITGGRLENLEIIGGYLYGIKLESDWNWGASIPNRHGTSNIVISHCKIHDTGRDCIKIPSGCDNITVENCTIYNSGIGISNDPNSPNAEGIDMVNNDNVIIRNNYIHNTSTTGVYAKGGCINVLIENNLVMNTGEGGILLGFYTDEEWFDTIANPNFYENIEGTVRNNIVINTNMDGIGMYAAYKPKVYNNTVINAAQNDHAALFFNTGYMWLDEINDMIAPPCVDVYVANNIFTVNSNRPNAQIRYYDDDTTSNMRGNNFINNNLYFKTNGAEFDDGINWQTLDISAWQNSTSFDSNSIEANPDLDVNYHLTSTSPCIDSGINITELTTDYDGNTRTQIFDIGADEYNAGNNLQVPPDTNILGTGNNDTTTFTFINNIFRKTVDLSIYPNPATSTIQLDMLNLSENQNEDIFIYNIYGQTVKQLKSEKYNLKIDIANLKTGIYFIRVGDKIVRFIKI